MNHPRRETDSNRVRRAVNGRGGGARARRAAVAGAVLLALTAGLVLGTSASELLTPPAAAVGTCTSSSSRGAGCNELVFTGAGTCTWNPPALVGWVDVVVGGGGGGGGGFNNVNYWGGGGGAGGYVETARVGVTPGSPVNITVGAGGAGATGSATYSGRPADAGGGEYSYFGDDTRLNDLAPPYAGAIAAMGGDGGQWAGQILATPSSTTTGGDGGQGQAGLNSGGSGGTGSPNGGAGGGGAGGVAGTGGVAKDGGAGGAGTTPTSGLFSGAVTAYGGGGGGGAGYQSSSAGTAGVAGTGGGGVGGRSTGPVATAGTAGLGGGGGGGGGGSAAASLDLKGANGGSGAVIIRWSTTPSYLVTYAGNGKTGGTVPADTTTYASGAPATVLGYSGLLKFGDAAGGWNTVAAGTGPAYTTGDTITMTSSVWLFAQWASGALPGAPVGPSLTACNGGVRVTWTAPAPDGGSPILGYKIRYDSNGAGYVDTNSTDTAYSVTGLVNGTWTYVAVAAITANGTGPLSQSADISTWPSARPLANAGTCPANGGGGGGGGGSTPDPAPTSAPSATPTATPAATPTATPTAAPASAPNLDPIPNQVNANIPASGVEVGGLVFLVGGQPVPVTVTPNAERNATALDITGSDFTMRLSGTGDDSAPLDLGEKKQLVLQSKKSAKRSGEVRSTSRARAKCELATPLAISSGTGFQASSPVKMYILPGTSIGTLTTNAAGTYSGSLPVPAGILAGSQTLQANGFAPSGAVRSLSLGITVLRGRTITAKSATEQVFFDPMSPVISAEGTKQLNRLVRTTKERGVRTVVIGFVQQTPTTSNDQSLSTQRARNVAAYLRGRGLTGAHVVRGDGIAGSGDAARRVNVTVRYQSGC